MKSSNDLFKYTIYSIGAGLASFIFVLLLNITGQYFGFKQNENVPIDEIGYINVILFLITIAIEAAAAYGLVFSLIHKVFRFK
ncbi:hypothetical protein [Shewanella livingstonensis]|uniref:Uncharacterized protein n=1 Tax=Shewanella livingstonensis TaxID=150120 RepID=A0A3G8LRF8_9GAMM|nr:hypothetical protein [Shewanella livingstonensis]AZG72007.1 hypothetical protein EGC82_04055 [Shewanella livingstonensis]